MLNNTQTFSDMWQNCLDRIRHGEASKRSS